MRLAAFFDEVDADRCGGKGKNLVALAAHRFPVPPGFVVTVDAYSLFESSGEMPTAVRAAIDDCYRHLMAQTGGKAVAVRSSAAAEDSAAASFAGLHDSYLEIDGLQAVLERTVECWRSLHSERAVQYRKMRGLAQQGQAMAVVVQAMVAARAAGVVFTANPYTLSANEMIVESARGPGENVVSGQVTPDYFEISKSGGFEILKKMPGSPPVGADAEPGQPHPGYSITDESLFELCGLAREIERAFGRPQDIEWAIEDDGSLSILQARPLARFGTDG